MWMFFLGLFVGIIVGAGIMCLITIGKAFDIEDIPEEIMEKAAMEYFTAYFNKDGTSKF